MTTELSQTLSDRDLVARAQSGDVLALDALVTVVRKAVLRYCRARLCTYSGGAEVAEDVTQEVCLAVVDVLPRYRDEGAHFGALVYAIAANKVTDARRRYGRTPLQLVEELPERAETVLDPEQQTVVRGDVAAVSALLDQLPPRMARVVRLRAEGLSAAEVGAIVGMNVTAVRVTQHRGIARIRGLVAASPEESERFADRWSVPAA